MLAAAPCLARAEFTIHDFAKGDRCLRTCTRSATMAAGPGIGVLNLVAAMIVLSSHEAKEAKQDRTGAGGTAAGTAGGTAARQEFQAEGAAGTGSGAGS